MFYEADSTHGSGPVGLSPTGLATLYKRRTNGGKRCVAPRIPRLAEEYGGPGPGQPDGAPGGVPGRAVGAPGGQERSVHGLSKCVLAGPLLSVTMRPAFCRRAFRR
jgi:hypothetical protein